jgi:predicted RNase H-like nuclease
MNERRPLPYVKNTWNGLMMRLELLRARDLELPHAIEAVGKVSANDIVDAAVAAWSAWRMARGEAGNLPDPSEVGPAGRAVAIRY